MGAVAQTGYSMLPWWPPALITLGTWWLRRRRTQAPAGHGEPSRRPVRRRWVLLGAGTVLTAVLVLILAVLGSPEPPTGAPDLPGRVRSVSLIGDARTVDLCRLVELEWLRQFGEPELNDSADINGCQVRIRRPGGAETRIDVLPHDLTGDMRTTVDFMEKQGGTVRWLGGLAVVRDRRVDPRPDDPDPTARGCRMILVLTDGTVLWIEVHEENSADPNPSYLRRVAVVAADVAIVTLARDGRLPQDPHRVPIPSPTGSDACLMLTRDELRRTVPGLSSESPELGFGHWSCDWGDQDNASAPHVLTRFSLNPDGARQTYGDLIPIGPRYGFRKRTHDPEQAPACTVSVPVSLPANPRSPVFFSVTVRSTQAGDANCDQAESLTAHARPRIGG